MFLWFLGLFLLFLMFLIKRENIYMFFFFFNGFCLMFSVDVF